MWRQGVDLPGRGRPALAERSLPSAAPHSLANRCSPRRSTSGARSARSASWCVTPSTRPSNSPRWVRQPGSGALPRRRPPPPGQGTRTAGRSLVHPAGADRDRSRRARSSASRRSIARRAAADASARRRRSGLGGLTGRAVGRRGPGGWPGTPAGRSVGGGTAREGATGEGTRRERRPAAEGGSPRKAARRNRGLAAKGGSPRKGCAARARSSDTGAAPSAVSACG